MSEDFLSDESKRHSSGKEFNRINTVPIAKMGLFPDALTFGYLDLGQLSTVQTVSVVNTGQKEITITEIDVTTDYDASFPQLPITLKPDESFAISITFLPQSSGPKNGSLYVNAGAVNGTSTVKLFGTGTTETYIPPDESFKAQALAVGIAPNANNLGTFTGGGLPANQSVKQTFQYISGLIDTIDDTIVTIGQNLFDINDEFTIKTAQLLAMAEAEQARGDQLVLDILAMGGEVDTLQTTVGTQGSSINTLQTSVTNALGSLAQHEIELDAHTVSINSTLTAVNGIELDMAAMETTLSTVGSTVVTQGSAITSLQGNFATLSTTVTTTGATVSSHTAAISTLDSELASMETTLSTAIGNNTAAINITAATLNGVEARYGVKLDVNGKVIGWVANNNGSTGGLDFVVDYFRIWNAAGGVSVAPFEFVGGSVYIKNATIQDGAISTAKIADAAITTAKIGALQVGTNNIAVNSVTEVDVANPAGISQTATNMAVVRNCITIAKPAGTQLVKITVLASHQVNLEAAGSEYIMFTRELRVSTVAWRSSPWSVQMDGTIIRGDSFNATVVFDAADISDGSVVDFRMSGSSASSKFLNVQGIQCIVEYIKR